MADLFESTINLEEQHVADGYQKGIEDGRAAGLQEGRDLGKAKGYEIGYEVGLYEGCVVGWRQRQREDAAALPARAEAAVASLEALLARMPLTDPKDDSLLEVLEAMRGKFKTIVAMLGTAEAYASKDATASSAASAAALDF